MYIMHIYIILYYIILYYILYYIILYYNILYYIILYYILLYYIILCYVMLCYVMLCYIIILYIIYIHVYAILHVYTYNLHVCMKCTCIYPASTFEHSPEFHITNIKNLFVSLHWMFQVWTASSQVVKRRRRVPHHSFWPWEDDGPEYHKIYVGLPEGI